MKNVFFHGDLKEEACMEIPLEFDTEQSQRKACGQKKVVHGLKHFPRALFDRSAMW